MSLSLILTLWGMNRPGKEEKEWVTTDGRERARNWRETRCEMGDGKKEKAYEEKLEMLGGKENEKEKERKKKINIDV